MLKHALVAAIAVVFCNAALAANATCEAQATEKKLAGAAKNSFVSEVREGCEGRSHEDLRNPGSRQEARGRGKDQLHEEVRHRRDDRSQVTLSERGGPCPRCRPKSQGAGGSQPRSRIKAIHMATYKVGYLVGSLASKSINRLLAKALVRLAPPELEFREIPIKDLPLYSYDYDADFPPVARAFKQAIAEVDAVLFVTPEYNRSIPGALKNAIDWASRPWGKNSFARKPSGVIGTSPGSIGTAVAQRTCAACCASATRR